MCSARERRCRAQCDVLVIPQLVTILPHILLSHFCACSSSSSDCCCFCYCHCHCHCYWRNKRDMSEVWIGAGFQVHSASVPVPVCTGRSWTESALVRCQLHDGCFDDAAAGKWRASGRGRRRVKWLVYRRARHRLDFCRSAWTGCFKVYVSKRHEPTVTVMCRKRWALADWVQLWGAENS